MAVLLGMQATMRLVGGKANGKANGTHVVAADYLVMERLAGRTYAFLPSAQRTEVLGRLQYSTGCCPVMFIAT